jgi:hypothetical protein
MEFEQVCRQLEDSRTEVMELQATIKKLKDDLGINLQEKALLQDYRWPNVRAVPTLARTRPCRAMAKHNTTVLACLPCRA